MPLATPRVDESNISAINEQLAGLQAASLQIKESKIELVIYYDCSINQLCFKNQNITSANEVGGSEKLLFC